MRGYVDGNKSGMKLRIKNYLNKDNWEAIIPCLVYILCSSIIISITYVIDKLFRYYIYYMCYAYYVYYLVLQGTP